MMRTEVVNLGELAHSISIKLQMRDPMRRVIISIAPELSVAGDKYLLAVMLAKLLENAWKFTSKREKTEILFDKETRNGNTVFFIRDNGAGFDMAHSHKLFSLFRRLHRIWEFGGAGIGLAIVRLIVARHKGQIWAHSEVNGGATFYFTLWGMG
jgi:light-regulated signal transduction histidine kinase (bacteriophytochrome)